MAIQQVQVRDIFGEKGMAIVLANRETPSSVRIFNEFIREFVHVLALQGPRLSFWRNFNIGSINQNKLTIINILFELCQYRQIEGLVEILEHFDKPEIKLAVLYIIQEINVDKEQQFIHILKRLISHCKKAKYKHICMAQRIVLKNLSESCIEFLFHFNFSDLCRILTLMDRPQLYFRDGLFDVLNEYIVEGNQFSVSTYCTLMESLVNADPNIFGEIISLSLGLLVSNQEVSNKLILKGLLSCNADERPRYAMIINAITQNLTNDGQRAKAIETLNRHKECLNNVIPFSIEFREHKFDVEWMKQLIRVSSDSFVQNNVDFPIDEKIKIFPRMHTIIEMKAFSTRMALGLFIACSTQQRFNVIYQYCSKQTMLVDADIRAGILLSLINPDFVNQAEPYIRRFINDGDYSKETLKIAVNYLKEGLNKNCIYKLCYSIIRTKFKREYRKKMLSALGLAIQQCE